jgi:hypothetical protein
LRRAAQNKRRQMPYTPDSAKDERGPERGKSAL